MSLDTDPYAVPKGDRMACHPGGEDAEGYDAEDSTCHNCADKFTCLPTSVAAPEIWTGRGAPAWRVEDDHEVCEVLDRQMTYQSAVDRIVAREEKVAAGDVIPAELLVRRITPKERRAKKKPPTPPQRPKVAARRVARSGGILPAPRMITEEQMGTALAAVKLGKRVEWEYGMQIVRRMRAKVDDRRIEHVVTLTPRGFVYDGEHYSSLSAAAQNASGTPCRSGNDWFNLRTSGCTEVRGIAGEIVASRTVGE